MISLSCSAVVVRSTVTSRPNPSTILSVTSRRYSGGVRRHHRCMGSLSPSSVQCTTPPDIIPTRGSGSSRTTLVHGIGASIVRPHHTPGTFPKHFWIFLHQGGRGLHNNNCWHDRSTATVPWIVQHGMPTKLCHRNYSKHRDNDTFGDKNNRGHNHSTNNEGHQRKHYRQESPPTKMDHGQRVGITQKLLEEKNFEQWKRTLLSTKGESYTSLDHLLRDWKQHMDNSWRSKSSSVVEDATLFSQLCLCIIQQKRTPAGLKLRVAQDGLVIWTRVVSHRHDETTAQEIFQQAQALFEAMPRPAPKQTNRLTKELEQRKGLYRLLFLVYSRSFHRDAVAKCCVLLEQLMQEDKLLTAERPEQGENDRDRILSQDAFHWTLRACAKSGDHEKWHNVHKSMNLAGFGDTAVTYDCLLQSLQTQIKMGDKYDVAWVRQEAVGAWEQLLQNYRQAPGKRWAPLPATLGKVLLLHTDDPQVSLNVVSDAILLVSDFPACQRMVDGPVLRIVLSTLVNHGFREAADHVGRFMMEAYNQGNGFIKPDVDHFFALVRSHTETGNFIKAKEYLDWMEHSENGNIEIYNMYLRALLSRRDDPVPEMEEILERIKKNTRPILSNMATYKSLMNGWVKSERPGYASRVDEIFQRAVSTAREQHDSSVPEMQGIVMDAWARSRLPESVDRCKEIFDNLQEPSIIHYNILMKAHALVGNAEDAEAQLREMIANPRIQVDSFSFNTAILGWRVAGDSIRALALLKLMIAFHLEQSQENKVLVSPDSIAVTKVLWSDPSRLLETAKEVWALIFDSGLQSRTDLLVPIVQALGDERDRDAAWTLIREFVQSIHEHNLPASKLLTSAADACRRLFPLEDDSEFRDRELTELFGECCDGGLLDKKTLEAFRVNLSPVFYQRLTLQDPRKTSNIELIPEIWRSRSFF